MSDEILVELYEEGTPVDADEVDRMTLALRRELLDIDDVESVSGVSAGPAPPGTRGLDIAALGALAVTVRPTVDVLVKVFGVVRGWLGSRESTMRVTVNGQSIELTPTKAQQTALVEAFITQAATRAES
jgi:Effector Associated Constant Component 1